MMRWLKGRGSRIFVQGWHKDNNLERNPNKTKEAIVDFNWAGNHSHTPIYTCWADLHLIKVLFPWSPHHQVLHLVSEIFSLDHKGTTVHTFVHIFKSPHIWGDLKSPTCAPGCWRKFHIVQLRAASQTASQCGTENALLQTLQSGWKLPKETFVFSYPPWRTFTGEKKKNTVCKWVSGIIKDTSHHNYGLFTLVPGTGTTGATETTQRNWNIAFFSLLLLPHWTADYGMLTSTPLHCH